MMKYFVLLLPLFFSAVAAGNNGQFQQCISAYNAKDFQTSIMCFDRAILEEPKNPDNFLYRGHARAELGDLRLALKDYGQAIALSPGDPAAYFYRGVLWFELKDYATAIKDYNMAIKLNDSYWSAYVNRGWAQFETGA